MLIPVQIEKQDENTFFMLNTETKELGAGHWRDRHFETHAVEPTKKGRFARMGSTGAFHLCVRFGGEAEISEVPITMETAKRIGVMWDIEHAS